MVTATSPLSIIIESKTSSTASWDSSIPHPSPLASHPFRIPTPNFSDLDIPSDLQYSSRPISAANLAGTRTSYLGGDLHETMRYSKQGRRRRSRDDIAALIEFLRTHEPPPDNFMSKPYGAEEEEYSRWDKVIGRKRSKSMGRAPAPLRLPDSAVAGVTTGGHRHIAISIPLDASHFGDTPKSQYPVFPNDAQPPVPPLPESIRTYKNEKGVVTVLRPLSPDHPYSSTPGHPSSPRRFDRDVPPQLLRNRRMVSPSSPPMSPTDSESWPLARSDSDRSSNAQQPSSPGESTEKSLPAPNGTAHSSSEFIRAAYPTRGSSIVPKPHPKHHHASSIDEVIAAENEAVNRNPSPMPREGVSRRQTERRTGRPPVSLATSPVARKSASNLRAEWQADKELPARQSRVTQITDSPIIDSREHSPSPPSSIISVKSRREKVRDKKLRDLAVARSLKLGITASPATASDSDKPIQDDVKNKSASSPDSDSGPTMSTIMVVVDVKPEGDDSPEATVVASNDDAGSVIEMLPDPVVKLPETTKGSCNPTPPTSTETSPSQRHGFDTRTSLTRRREWQTNRELERKKREAAAVAKAQLRQLAASGTYAGMDISDPEREILRLYEAYREQRLRDMEGRVRRLERNGDVWLRALIPMLEDMNSGRIGNNQPRKHSINDDESIRDWASDDETTSSRATQHHKLIRRASLSRERMLEELMRREERDMRADYEAEAAAVKDANGMGSIEPLMRELASGHAATSALRTANAPQPAEAGVPPIPTRLRGYHTVRV